MSLESEFKDIKSDGKGVGKKIYLHGLEREFNRLDKLEQNLDKPYNPQKHNDETRSTIAITFVKSFFKVITWSLFWVLLYNFVLVVINWKTGADVTKAALNVETILPIIISAIAGPLGFVVGYYFKSSQ